MAALRILLGVLSLGAHAVSAQAHVSLRAADDVTLQLEPQLTGGFLLVLLQDEERIVYGHIGRTLVSPYTIEEVEGGVEVSISDATLQLRTVWDAASGARGVKVRWDTHTRSRLEDCIDFDTKQWYGGPMQQEQVYPVQRAAYRYSGYVVTDVDNGAIMERYWLNSAGEYIYVHPEVPLFVDYNNLHANHICFGAQLAEPYSSKREHTSLSYDIWFLSDVKKAHKHAVSNYLGKPTDVPDFTMIQHPIWSTWAEYSQEINSTKTLEFANQILKHGFNNSQIEIDDLWEVCYGSLAVDEEKFPNFGGLVQELKELGYRVTLWIHPFINKGCDPWYTEALEKGYFAASEDGNVDSWWWNLNGTVAGLIDFTNPEAAEWWSKRVKTLQDTYGIDSFKFDAGETNYIPQVSAQTGDIDYHPHHIVESYVRTCAKFGDMIEVRVGFRTQDLPIFVRMVDRDSVWGLNNGLSSVLTTSLQMSLSGYPFILPDMIGGNGFNLNHEQADLPSKELFIRWVQATALLPAMQFSFPPWKFDEETIEISRKYAALHAEYANHVYEGMLKAVNSGTPLVAPLWWADPLDNVTHDIWDEFLLGETVLVAPVLTPNTTERPVYLPAGTWYAENDPERVHEGPVWITYDAPLDVLPYFVKEKENETGSASLPTVSALLVTLSLLFHLF